MDICQYAFVQTIECMIPRLKPKINSGLWMVMMCQCRLISGNKCSPLVGDVNGGGGCACVWAAST